MRRWLGLVLVALVGATGLTVTAPPQSVPTAYAASDPTKATITGTVSRSVMPAWDEVSDTSTDRFALELLNQRGDVIAAVYYLTGPSATYQFQVEPGSYTLRAWNFDYWYEDAWFGGGANEQSAQYFTVSAGQTYPGKNLNIPLMATISGTATNSGGVPPGDSLWAYAVNKSDNFVRGSAEVAPDGSYHIGRLDAGSYYIGFLPNQSWSNPRPDQPAGLWWKSRASQTGATAVTVTTGQQRTGIDQTLPEGGVISGRLTDAEGRSPRGAAVIYDAKGSRDQNSTLVKQIEVDDNGYYALWGVPNGSYKVGFNTSVMPAPSPAASRITEIGRGTSRGGSVSMVDVGEHWATNLDGSLRAADPPWLAAWYAAPGLSWSAAKTVTISATRRSVANVNGILPVLEQVTRWRDGERAGGRNASQKPVTCLCVDPVDTYSGEYTESLTDLELPGSGPLVAIDRSYVSRQAGKAGPFGSGSSSSISARLKEVPGTLDTPLATVEVTQENGSTVTFTSVVDRASYVAAARVDATLNFDSYRRQWIFTRRGTDTMRFSEAGLLVSRSDRRGVTVEYQSDAAGRVTSILGSGGRTLTLTWAGDRISSVRDSAGRSVAYDYNADGDLISFTAPDGRITSFGYDTARRISTITAPDGGLVRNVYDDQGRVTSQTDAVGRITVFTYAGTPENQTTTVTDPAGVSTVFTYTNRRLTQKVAASGTALAATTKYGYNPALDLISTTDPLGKTTSMVYDDDGNMVSSTDPLGATTRYTYDSLHNVTSVQDSLGRVGTASYDSYGSRTSSTTPAGETTSWVYNSDGTTASLTDPLGAVTTYDYDAAGRAIGLTDPLGRSASLTLDPDGHQVSTTDPTGATMTRTVDEVGRPTTATDALGRVTAYQYDAAGRAERITDPAGQVTSTAYNLAGEATSTTDAGGRTTATTYSPLGKVATVTDPLGAVTTTGYDALGRPVSVTDPKGLKSTTTYDKAGRITQVRTPAGNITKYTYDAIGRKLSSIDPLGNTTTYAYDSAGQLLTTTDPLGRITANTYDLNGRITSVIGPDGKAANTGYDPAGRTTSVVDADGNQTTYAYDAAGQRLSRTEPGNRTTSWTYDAAGRVTTIIKPSAATITQNYDAAGQLLGRSSSDGTVVAFDYDALGRRTSMTDNTGTTSYTYTPTGRYASVTNGAGQVVSYTWDAADRLASLTYPGAKTVSYGYDTAGRMTSLTDWVKRKTSFTWTSDSALLKQTDANKVATSYAYDKLNRVTSISTALGTAAPLRSFTYGYDTAGQLTSDSVDGTSRTYAYDPIGQLTAQTSGSTTKPFAATSAGSLTTQDQAAQQYNDRQQLVSATTATGTTSFGYDEDGSRTSTSFAGATTLYSYNTAGDLTQVTQPTGLSVDYTSNGDGLRQSRRSGQSVKKLTWDSSGTLPLMLGDGDQWYVYGPTTTPVAQIDQATGAVQYLHGDLIGSTRLITSATGAAIGSRDYEPYGAVTNSSGATTAIGYSGAWTDSATSLIYLRAREYDPATGQFLQIDPARDSTGQPYAYAANSPTDTTDPTGLRACAPEYNSYTQPGDCVPGATSTPQPTTISKETACDIWIEQQIQALYAAQRADLPESLRSFYDWWTQEYAPRARAIGPAIGAISAGGARGGAPAVARVATVRARTIPLGPVPRNAAKVFEYVESKGTAPTGFKGGAAYKNDGRGGSMLLPDKTADGASISYREWDINARVEGQDRGGERIVTGNDGSAYYTRDHYESFVKFAGN